MHITSEPHGSLSGHHFSAVWTAISTFCDTTWFLTSSLFGALFKVMLPAMIAAVIVCGAIFAVIWAVIYFVNWMGWTGSKFADDEKTETSSSQAAGDGVLVDLLNDKRRVEIEIELLEELLRAKRESLKNFE
jgi:hypothetical protein